MPTITYTAPAPHLASRTKRLCMLVMLQSKTEKACHVESA